MWVRGEHARLEGISKEDIEEVAYKYQGRRGGGL